MKVIFDVGHAKGTGARGQGQEEHELCARFAAKLAQRRRAKGNSVLTLDFPEQSNAADLSATIRAANAEEGVAFGVSFHMDSGPATARGGHVCYKSTKGRQLAEALAAPLGRVMPGRAELTVQRQDLAVLNRTMAPWVLVELGFISSAGDILHLMDDPLTPEDELEPLLAALDKGLDDACALASRW